jgi:hypothetical protein
MAERGYGRSTPTKSRENPSEKREPTRSSFDYGPPFGRVFEPNAPYRKIRERDAAKARRKKRGKIRR